MLKNKRIIGMTLLESLIALSVTGLAGTAWLKNQSDEQEIAYQKQAGVEFQQILSAIDARLLIDGYNETLWGSKLTYGSANFNEDFLKAFFNSKDSKCSGKWIPQDSSKNELQLLPCDLWAHKTPYGLLPTVEISNDGNGFINKIELRLSFRDQANFEDNVNNVRKALYFSKGLTNEVTGSHIKSFVDANTGEELTNMECLSSGLDCEVSLKYETSVGFEALAISGNNSMVNSSVSFVESKNSSPLNCQLWKKQPDSSWAANSVECGIGIYEGTPVVVDVAVNDISAKNGYFEEDLVSKQILLNKTCDNFKIENDKVVANGQASCGMTNDGTIVVSVVDNSIASQGIFKNLNGDVLKAGSAEVFGLLKTKDLTVSGQTNLNGAVTVNNDLKMKANGVVKFDFNKTTGKTTISDLYVTDLNVKNGNIETLKVTKKLSVTDSSGNNIFEVNSSTGKTTISDLEADKADIDNLTSENITSENITSDNLAVNGTSTLNNLKVNGHSDLNSVKINGNLNANNIWGNNMTLTGNIAASTGSITEYDNKFKQIESALNSLQSQIAPPPPPAPDYAALERACNAKANEESGRTYPQDCSAGYIHYYDFYWRGDIKQCDKKTVSVFWKKQKKSNKECSGGGR